MWRTSKVDVLNEIDLPPQTEQLIELRFSSVEAYFYRRQHEECSTNVTALLRRNTHFNQKMKTKLMLPLLKLRQACCHPQVASKKLGTLQKNTMTMDEVRDRSAFHSTW